MKKVLIALSISALTLSFGGAASAQVADQAHTAVDSSMSVLEGTVTVMFTPEGKYHTMDQSITVYGLGAKIEMNGDNHVIMYGSDVVEIVGKKAKIIGYGTAQVQALKNGQPLGVYTFIVKR